MGLDPAAVSLMLSGRRKMTVSEAKEIARALGVDVAEVLAHCGSGNVVAGPGYGAAAEKSATSARDFSRQAGSDEKSREINNWEREFMARWTELGMFLLRRPG
jgi:hypothetical protein